MRLLPVGVFAEARVIRVVLKVAAPSVTLENFFLVY